MTTKFSYTLLGPRMKEYSGLS